MKHSMWILHDGKLLLMVVAAHSRRGWENDSIWSIPTWDRKGLILPLTSYVPHEHFGSDQDKESSYHFTVNIGQPLSFEEKISLVVCDAV